MKRRLLLSLLATILFVSTTTVVVAELIWVQTPNFYSQMVSLRQTIGQPPARPFTAQNIQTAIAFCFSAESFMNTNVSMHGDYEIDFRSRWEELEIYYADLGQEQEWEDLGDLINGYQGLIGIVDQRANNLENYIMTSSLLWSQGQTEDFEECVDLCEDILTIIPGGFNDVDLNGLLNTMNLIEDTLRAAEAQFSLQQMYAEAGLHI